MVDNDLTYLLVVVKRGECALAVVAGMEVSLVCATSTCSTPQNK